MTIIDPNFKPGETANILKQFNLSPDNIVFEITEHSSTANFSCFHKMLNHYRNQGYKVAIDDVGAGYAGLVALADIQPDYIKLDRSLTSDLCKNKMKQSIIASIVTLSKYNGTTVIAEGIETKEDMDILMELGVLLGQGYYIAKPAYPKPLPNLDIFKNSTDKKFFSYLRTNIRLKELSIKSTVIESGTPINVVKDKMDKSVDPINYLVITKGTKPLGVVKSFVLDKKLSTLYGTSLYYNKPIDTFMERDCIIVDEDTTLDEISKILLQKKDKTYLYECIVLTKHSKFSGIVPFDKLIHQLFEIQIQLAKGSNPLTGLPGNIAIEREIEKRMNSNILFEIAYIDMDNFKAYNDAYGFKAGDKIILLLAKIISHICNKKGKGAFFIGHVGGDDFVIIGSANKLEKMCHCIVSLFERLSKVFYSKEDLQNGFITGKTREGNIQKYPLITLSIGILRCRGYCSFSEFSKRVAEIKSYAKSIKGNSVVVDRRQVLGNK